MVEVTALEDLQAEPHAEAFDGPPRTVRLELGEGDRIPPHTHPDTRIVLHLLSGRLSLDVGEETVALAPGDVARFGGDREISPLAETDATALLVFAPHD